MADTGFASPGAFASVQVAAGDVAWGSMSNASLSDNAYAAAGPISGNGFSERFECALFGLNVPAGATIDGVEVTIERKTIIGGPTVFADDIVSLIVGGLVQGADRSVSTPWTPTETTITYGGPSDLWGLALTADDVNASNFGLALRVNRTGGSGQVAQVDHVQVRVYYTAPSGQEVAVGQAAETDTAQLATLERAVAVEQAAEAATALQIAVERQVVIGQASETSSALQAGIERLVHVGLATETSTGLASAIERILDLGLAVEADSAFAVMTGAIVVTIGQAVEADSALATAIARAVEVGFAQETDAAITATVERVVHLAQAQESDGALAAVVDKAVELGIVDETDTALAVTIPPPGFIPDPGRTLVVRGRDRTLVVQGRNRTLN